MSYRMGSPRRLSDTVRGSSRRLDCQGSTQQHTDRRQNFLLHFVSVRGRLNNRSRFIRRLPWRYAARASHLAQFKKFYRVEKRAKNAVSTSQASHDEVTLPRAGERAV
jgi:hypothetical protein